MQLTDKEQETVLSIIRSLIPPSTEVFYYGSRVNGTARISSDLDVLLKGPAPIDLATLALIKEKFEDSDLPFKVDLLDYHTLSKKMLGNISKSLVRFF